MPTLGIVLCSHDGSTREIVRHVSPLWGGAGSQLVEDSNGDLWVSKFIGNPQGTSVLAKEALGNLLGRRLGLSVPTWSPVWLSEEFFEEQKTWFGHGPRRRPLSSIHYACRFYPFFHRGYCQDGIVCSPEMLEWFAGISLFDIWTSHADRREYISTAEGIKFVDNGNLFGQRAAMALFARRYDLLQSCDATVVNFWIDKILGIGLDEMENFWRFLPSQWREGMKSPAPSLRRRANVIANLRGIGHHEPAPRKFHIHVRHGDPAARTLRDL